MGRRVVNINHSVKNAINYILKNIIKIINKIILIRIQIEKKDLQNFINTIKTSKGCSYCGETDFACLDFHHMGEKESEIARAIHNGWSKERLLKEINKCIVICSNCHRKLHYYGSVV